MKKLKKKVIKVVPPPFSGKKKKTKQDGVSKYREEFFSSKVEGLGPGTGGRRW